MELTFEDALRIARGCTDYGGAGEAGQLDPPDLRNKNKC